MSLRVHVVNQPCSINKVQSYYWLLLAPPPASRAAPSLPSLPSSRSPSHFQLSYKAMSTATFPRRLYEILASEDGSAIAWDPDGTSFRILNTELFTSVILPRSRSSPPLTTRPHDLVKHGEHSMRLHILQALPTLQAHVFSAAAQLV